ncbi:MAG: hypothetical protein QGD94_08780 [Planctomycetia bacterium]|nr:hypothetical protein [Planctomycetia bacterium]
MLRKHQAKRIITAGLWLCVFVPLAALAGVVVWLKTGGLDEEFSRDISSRLALPVTVEGVELQKPGWYRIRRLTIGTTVEGWTLAEAEGITIGPASLGSRCVAVVERLRLDLDFNGRTDAQIAALERRLMRPFGQRKLAFIGVRSASVEVGFAGIRTTFDGVDIEIRIGESGLHFVKGIGGGIIFEAQLSSDGAGLIEFIDVRSDVAVSDFRFPSPLGTGKQRTGEVSGQLQYEGADGGRWLLKLKATGLEAAEWTGAVPGGPVTGKFDLDVKELSWVGGIVRSADIELASTGGGTISGPTLGWMQRQSLLGLEGYGDYLLGASVDYDEFALRIAGAFGNARISGACDAGKSAVAVSTIFSLPIPVLSATGREFSIDEAWRELSGSIVTGP